MSYVDKQVFIHDLKHLVVQQEALGCGAVWKFKPASLEVIAADVAGCMELP